MKPDNASDRPVDIGSDAVNPFFRTVWGDKPAEEMGITYAHEHLIIDSCYVTEMTPEFLLDDTNACTQELRRLFQIGGRTVIDSMPCDCGRNVLKLAEASRASGVQIVAPTGLHLSKYYDPGHWSHAYSEMDLEDLFVADIREGIDANDYNGPLISRTSHGAGVIKIATDRQFAARERRVFAAAAAAHRQTGCPILTHTEQGELALEQISLLQDLGVDLRHVCLSHTDRKPDVGYHREILSSGVSVEFDSAFRWKPAQGNPTLDLLVTLLGEFRDQIMLGMDAAKRSYWKSYGGGPGLEFLLGDFSQRMKAAGIGAELLERIFVSTPRKTYCFRTIKQDQ
jgi:predicted metal-dependent phosphotriesterase family hydrolase